MKIYGMVDELDYRKNKYKKYINTIIVSMRMMRHGGDGYYGHSSGESWC